MDTIGAVQPTGFVAPEENARVEVFERLRYLALHRRYGVLVGRRGSGKSQVFESLEGELKRDGSTVSRINLSGVTAHELPFLVAADLGLGLSPSAGMLQTWIELQDYSHGCQQTEKSHVFLFDQVDRAPAELSSVLDRMLSLFNSTFACLFATRPKYSAAFRKLFKNHSWMKVELNRLSSSDAAQTIARQLANESSDIQISQDAFSAMEDAANGRVDKIHRLTELALLAAEAEEIQLVNEEIIRSIQSELKIR